MLVQTFLQTQTDRLIAMGRAAVAVFSLAATWLDPTQPTATSEFTYWLLVAYLAFAAAILLASQRERVWSAEIAFASHLIDLAAFSTLMVLTEGLASPYFLLFTFSLLSATFRWQWKGALWTAIAVLVVLVLIATLYPRLVPGVPFDIERFVLRCAHVVVIGAMLIYFGFRQQHTAEEAARLAAWQPDSGIGSDSRAVLNACLAHVADVFAAPRAVLVLQEGEEPWASVSVWDRGRFRQDRLAAATAETIVPDALAESGFIRTAAGDVLVASGPGRLVLWRGSLLDPDLQAYRLDRVLSVPVHSEGATGRLFVADNTNFSREDLTLASLLAAQIGVALDRMQVIEAAKQSAALEERLRLARDLHDGVLQSLAGTALQLESLKALAERDPATARAKIDDMQSWLLAEQREMRRFIGKLHPIGASGRSGSAEESFNMPALVKALERQWGVAISTSAAAASLVLPADMEFHIRQIIREAVANAARHGGASEVSFQASLADNRLRLLIADNGKGLPVHGQFDERQSAQARIGPRSLRERLVSLGGSLIVDSTPAGLTLSIDLPLRTANAAAVDRSNSR